MHRSGSSDSLEKQTDRQTDRQTGRQAGRHTHTHTHTHTHREREREREREADGYTYDEHISRFHGWVDNHRVIDRHSERNVRAMAPRNLSPTYAYVTHTDTHSHTPTHTHTLKDR